MSDRFDSPAVSDFPTDPAANHDVLFWIVITVGLIVLASFLTVWFKRSERKAGLGISDAIDARATVVFKALANAAKATRGEQIAKAEEAKASVHEQFGNTLDLSAKLSKVVGKLNGAIEGTRDELYKGGGTGPSHVSGGTIINIAVNGSGDAQAVASPYSAAPAPAPSGPAPKVPMTPDEKSESVWKAVQKLFNHWKNRAAVIAAFRAAQQQLMASPAWEDPREDEPSKPRKS